MSFVRQGRATAASVNEGFSIQQNQSVQGLGRPSAMRIGQLNPSHGDHIVAKTSSGDADVRLPSTTGKRIGDRVTVVNEGSHVAYVHAPANGSINGWQCYPILRNGDSAVFIQTTNKTWHVSGSFQKMNWPKFSIASITSATITAAAFPGAPETMAIRMNDGSIRTSLSETCDITATGIGGVDPADGAGAANNLYHIFAVPRGVKNFGLVLSKGAVPPGGGPQSYPVFRYMFSWRVLAGPVFSGLSHTSDGWFCHLKTDSYSLMSGGAGAFTPAATTWLQVDGTTYYVNFATASPFNFLPAGIADQIDLGGWFQKSNSTAAQGVYIGTGTVASPPWTAAAVAQALVMHKPGSGATATYGSSVFAMRMPILSGGLVVAFNAAAQVDAINVGFRGYHLPTWGND